MSLDRFNFHCALSTSLQCSVYEMDYGHHHPDGGHTYMAVPRTPPQASHKMQRGSPIQLLEELCHKSHHLHHDQ